MTRIEVSDALASDDPDVVLDGLAALKGMRDTPPTRQVARACEQLIKHADPDVRSEAIAVLGILWALPQSFASILGAARHDEDTDVRVTATRALTRYVDLRRGEVCSALAAIVREESRSDLRAIAYVGLLGAEGRLSPSQKATMPENIEELDIDMALLRRWA